MRWTTRSQADDDRRDADGARIAPQWTPDIEPAGPLGLDTLPRGFEFSPINRRRWQNFKSNRRGYWSLWLFLFLFFATLFAEFIANDKPMFIHFDGKSYFPVFVTYPDTDFGDDLGTAADYRDPHLQKFLDEHNAIEIWPPIRFSYNAPSTTIRRRHFRPSRPGC